MCQRLAHGSDQKIECHLDFDAEIIIEDTDIEIFRILQEALSNAVKHAEAGLISVTIRQEKEFLIAEVQDDGIGLATAGSRTEGAGSQTMRERAQLLGGQMEISSMPEGGTLVWLKVPV